MNSNRKIPNVKCMHCTTIELIVAKTPSDSMRQTLWHLQQNPQCPLQQYPNPTACDPKAWHLWHWKVSEHRILYNQQSDNTLLLGRGSHMQNR